MRGQKYRIFGNVEQIKQFHETQLLPALRSARENILQISETFVQFYIVSCIRRHLKKKMFMIFKFFNFRMIIFISTLSTQ